MSAILMVMLTSKGLKVEGSEVTPRGPVAEDSTGRAGEKIPNAFRFNPGISAVCSYRHRNKVRDEYQGVSHFSEQEFLSPLSDFNIFGIRVSNVTGVMFKPCRSPERTQHTRNTQRAPQGGAALLHRFLVFISRAEKLPAEFSSAKR